VVPLLFTVTDWTTASHSALALHAVTSLWYSFVQLALQNVPIHRQTLCPAQELESVYLAQLGRQVALLTS
jgi:hypothetical protein